MTWLQAIEVSVTCISDGDVGDCEGQLIHAIPLTLSACMARHRNISLWTGGKVFFIDSRDSGIL